MKRREFSAVLASMGLGPAALLGGGHAAAQGVPIEGTHYVKLAQPAQTLSIRALEVIEFFWYGCPHCHEFEPQLDAWAKKLPADVNFQRMPVAFRAEPHTTHQRIFFALEQMGKVGDLHRKVFHAIHVERLRLGNLSEAAAWMAKNGIDGAKFTEVAKSKQVDAKIDLARKLAEAYKIDGVPALGIGGRFYTAGSLAGGNTQMLAVADFLLARMRKG